MLPLPEFQRSLAHGILAGELPPAMAFAAGRIPAAAALLVHRNTVVGALAEALRLTFPTVDALVGEKFFDHAANVFAQICPPITAQLAGYGEGFPEFLEGYAPASQLSYLADVARLDLAMDRALLGSPARRVHALTEAVSLDLPSGLTILRLDHPAELIRDGLAAGNDTALAMIDLRPSPRWLAIWRAGRQVSVRAITAPAAAFLASLLSGATAERAFAAAVDRTTPQAAMQAIQEDIFAASFCHVIPHPEEKQP